jgi:oligoendopeptidase F
MTKSLAALPVKHPRVFVKENSQISEWKDIEPYFQELEQRPILSLSELEKWMRDRSELEAFVSEDLGWRYIKMTCNTEDTSLLQDYQFFVSEIEPQIAPFTNRLNKKLIASPLLNQLDQQKYAIYLRAVKKSLELFREENIALFSQIQNEQQKYAAITGAMTIEWEGKEITLQQASLLLKDINREKRELAYKRIVARRLQDADALDKLFDDLLQLRHKVALNAGYANFRDYMFDALGRFDYGPQDCFNFHQSIKNAILPLEEQIDTKRKEFLRVSALKPWDMDVDTSGMPALKPYSDAKDLVKKTIACFAQLDSYFAECIEVMQEMAYLDLDSRKGKAPGGYNYPLYEIGVPFIFMNSVGSHRDMVTMLHEGGHAIHNFLTHNLELTDFKSTPSEVAELASMSMELLSMEHWNLFFQDAEELKRAKQEQLEQVLSTLVWVATIDKFQHWIYENPNQTEQERSKEWINISKEFGSKIVNWEGFENAKAKIWQKQLHLYEVPFYYIEYGMAQLGAIAIWRNYKINSRKAIQDYTNALKLGYTKSIGEIYATAGIQFDFSENYVRELADFVKLELANL